MQIAAWYGDVYTDLATIVAASNSLANSSTNLPAPALTVPQDDCLIIAIGKKNKTATSDGASLTKLSWSTAFVSWQITSGSTTINAWDYLQQSVAADISAVNWAQSISESLDYCSLVVALKTSTPTTKYLKAYAHPSAAGETGCEVVVHSAPGGANYVTGTTRYGSANSKSFDGATEGTGLDERAVLQIPAADVGCSGLAVDTVVAVCAQNATYTTGVIPGTIIEE